MRMTKPPCYRDGADCPRRYVGCKAGCEEWHRWLAIHEREKNQIRENKARDTDANDFLIGQTLRVRQAMKRK